MKICYLLAFALLAQSACISLANAAELIQANNIGALLEKFDKQDQKKLEKELFSLLNKYQGKGYLDTSYTMGAEGVWIGRFHYNLNGHTYEINVEVIAPDQNKDVARPFREMAVVVNYLQGGAWRLAVQLDVLPPALTLEGRLQGVGNFHTPKAPTVPSIPGQLSRMSYDFEDKLYGWIFFDLPWEEGRRDIARMVRADCPKAGECKIISDEARYLSWQQYPSVEVARAAMRRPPEDSIRKESIPYQQGYAAKVDGDYRGPASIPLFSTDLNRFPAGKKYAPDLSLDHPGLKDAIQ